MHMKEHWIGTQCMDTNTSMSNNYMIEMGGEVKISLVFFCIQLVCKLEEQINTLKI